MREGGLFLREKAGPLKELLCNLLGMLELNKASAVTCSNSAAVTLGNGQKSRLILVSGSDII